MGRLQEQFLTECICKRDKKTGALWMDNGCVGGRTNGRTDGWVDGWID